MANTPYTTRSGVKIGQLYRPTTRVYHDADAQAVQRAMLRQHYQPEPFDWEGVKIVAGLFAAFVATIIVALI